VNPPPGEPPPPLDADGYVRARVEQQISTYYRPKARAHARHAEQCRWAETSLAVVAALPGAYASAIGSSAWGTVGSRGLHHCRQRFGACRRRETRFSGDHVFRNVAPAAGPEERWTIAQKPAPSKEWFEFVSHLRGSDFGRESRMDGETRPAAVGRTKHPRRTRANGRESWRPALRAPSPPALPDAEAFAGTTCRDRARRCAPGRRPYIPTCR
jgi:hypothetical protein